MPSGKEIRERILAKRGYTTNPAPGAGGLVRRVLNRRRSSTVTLVEEYYKMPIEDVLKKYQTDKIVADTGVSRVTIWRWKKHLAGAS